MPCTSSPVPTLPNLQISPASHLLVRFPAPFPNHRRARFSGAIQAGTATTTARLTHPSPRIFATTAESRRKFQIRKILIYTGSQTAGDPPSLQVLSCWSCYYCYSTSTSLSRGSIPLLPPLTIVVPQPVPASNCYTKYVPRHDAHLTVCLIPGLQPKPGIRVPQLIGFPGQSAGVGRPSPRRYHRLRSSQLAGRHTERRPVVDVTAFHTQSA